MTGAPWRQKAAPVVADWPVALIHRPRQIIAEEITVTAAPAHGEPLSLERRPPRRRRGSRTLKRACLVACTAIAAAAAIVGCGAPSTTYRASVVSYTAPEPGDLSVSVRVTNTGTAAGTPTCTIDARFGSGARAGSNRGKLGASLAPGHSSMLDMLVAIPDNRKIGSVTTVSARC